MSNIEGILPGGPACDPGDRVRRKGTSFAGTVIPAPPGSGFAYGVDWDPGYPDRIEWCWPDQLEVIGETGTT